MPRQSDVWAACVVATLFALVVGGMLWLREGHRPEEPLLTAPDRREEFRGTQNAGPMTVHAGRENRHIAPVGLPSIATLVVVLFIMLAAAVAVQMPTGSGGT